MFLGVWAVMRLTGDGTLRGVVSQEKNDVPVLPAGKVEAVPRVGWMVYVGQLWITHEKMGVIM